MNVFHIAMIITAVLLIISGLFLLFKTYNMLRVLIGIEIMMKAVTLLLVFAGYMTGNMATAESYVVTVIVIEVVIAVVACGIAINLFRKNGDMDLRHVNKLNG